MKVFHSSVSTSRREYANFIFVNYKFIQGNCIAIYIIHNHCNSIVTYKYNDIKELLGKWYYLQDTTLINSHKGSVCCNDVNDDYTTAWVPYKQQSKSLRSRDFSNYKIRFARVIIDITLLVYVI